MKSIVSFFAAVVLGSLTPLWAETSLGLPEVSLGYAALERGDYDTAIAQFTKAAEYGNAEAQNHLGFMYSNGDGVARNYKTSVSWYRKAAEQGDPSGQFSLGNMYRNGKGVPQDDSKAVYWYRKAAEQGLAIAQFFLGRSYELGKGVRKDYVQAYRWLDLAATQGDEDARLARDRIAELMKPAQLTEAQRLVSTSLANTSRNISSAIEPSQGTKGFESEPDYGMEGHEIVAKVEASRPGGPVVSDEDISYGTPVGSKSTADEEQTIPPRRLIRDIQARLSTLGYNPGPIDGIAGPKTIAATKAFQRDTGISPDGYLSEELLEHLESSTPRGGGG